MTRKDYELIAGTMTSEAGATFDAEVRKRLIDEMARRFNRDNPQFDWARFIAACGSAGGNA